MSITPAGRIKVLVTGARGKTGNVNEEVTDARNEAVAARDAAVDVSTGNQYVFFDNKADADFALASLPENQLVMVFVDESQNGSRTAYKKIGGAYSLRADFTAAARNLSNITNDATAPSLRVKGSVANSPYLGGVDSDFQVAGLAAFRKDTNGGEFRFSNYWDGNNSLSVQNLSNSDAYSSVRYLDYQGREAMAVGYGNPGTVADLPFAGAGYVETSSFINADGSANNGIPPRPIRFVVSGYMDRRDGSKSQGVFGRASVESDGSWNFYHLDPRWSFARPMVTFTDSVGMYNAYFFDHDDALEKDARKSPVLRIRRKNYSANSTYVRPGVVIGSTYEGSPQTGGTPPPQVALDVGGTILAGTDTSIDRSQNYTSPNGVDFAIATMQPNEQHIRLFKPGVGKIDLLFQNGDARGPCFSIADPDNANKIAFSASVNGKQNVYINGSTDSGGGSGVIAIRNSDQVPSANPGSGGVLYVEAGALKYRGSTGTVTTVAPA